MNLIQMSIRRPIFISCIVVLMLIVGFTSLRKLGVDQFPDVTFPVVSIQTVYPGASPNDVEEQISKKIEEEIGSINGLKTLSSANLESVSVIIAEFTLGTDVKNAEQQIRERLGQVRRKLPTEVQDPIVRRMDPADQPILRLGVSSDADTTQIYQSIQDFVKSPLERVPGVGLVEIVGGRKKEVQVLIDKDKLQNLELSVLQVANRIGATSKNVPLGKFEASQSETVLRSVGDFGQLEELGRVNVNFIGSDRGVKLQDVAKITMGSEPEKTRSTLNGKSAMLIDVYKQSGGNTVKVAKAVSDAVPKINDDLKRLGVKAEVQVVRDGAWAIRANVDDVKESIYIGIALCVVVVFFFLGSFKSTIITGLALPNSLLGAFILMYALGFTINIMTLLALSLAVGLLVDDAIVVRENIFRHLEMGEAPEVAAEKGTSEVTMAVIATTLVVIAIFGPIAFLDGIVGQFFKQFGLTIVFAVAISLFDALTVAPMLSARWASSGIHKRGKGPIDALLNGFDSLQTALEKRYEGVLKFTLRRPLTVLAIAFAVFFGSLTLLKGIPKTFLPPADNGEFEVRLELPPGSSLDKSYDLATRIDREIHEHPAILLTTVVAGSRDGEPNRVSIYARLKPSKERKEKTGDLKNIYRERLTKYQNEAVVTVQDYDFVGGGLRPFTLNVSGEDLDVLSQYVEKLKARMKQIPGLVDVDTNYRSGKPELQVVFDRKKAESLGVATSQAGAELRARIEGIVPTTFREGQNEYDIRVRLEDRFKDLSKEFSSTFIPNVNFNMIPLSKVAQPKSVVGFSQINRQNKGRYIQISGDLGPGGALGAISDETTRIISTELQPPPGVTWGFIGQAQDFKDLIANMITAITLGVIFIYLVLSSLYESFITPFTILLALPLAVCGALGALYITQASINIFSMIGIVMLLGVVTKNSILLVDYTTQLIDDGMERSEALLKACKTRLRPILMTSFALIAGTIPIAIGLNEASKQRTAMGVAIIGGLISSTLLTLVVIPAAYGYVDNFRKFVNRLFRSKPNAASNGGDLGVGIPTGHGLKK